MSAKTLIPADISSFVATLRDRTTPLDARFAQHGIFTYATSAFYRASRFLIGVAFCLVWVAGGICCIAIPSPLAVTIVGAVMLGLFVIAALISLRTVITNGLPFTLPPEPEQGYPFTDPRDNMSPLPSAREKKVQHTTIYIIYNPLSGVGGSQGIVENIVLPKLKEENIAYTLLPTAYAGHCRDYVYTLPFQQHSAILIIGGDGSLYEATNGLMKRQEDVKKGTYSEEYLKYQDNCHAIPFGILPAGSGNSFCADLGTWDIKKALNNFIYGEVMSCDVNHIRDFLSFEEEKMFSSTTTTKEAFSTPEEIKKKFLYKAQPPMNVYSTNTICFGLVGDLAVAAENNRWLGTGRYDICGFWGLMKRVPYALSVIYTEEKGWVSRYSGTTQQTQQQQKQQNTQQNKNNNENNDKTKIITTDNNTTNSSSQDLTDNKGNDNNVSNLTLDTLPTATTTNDNNNNNTNKNQATTANLSSLSSPSPARACALRIQTEEFLTVFANHTKYFGRGHCATPYASMNDGKCDVVLAKNINRGQLLTLFNQLPSGSHVNWKHDAVQLLQSAEFALVPYDLHDEKDGKDKLLEIREELSIFDNKDCTEKTNVEDVLKQNVVDKYQKLFKQYFITVDGEILAFYGGLHVKVIPNAIQIITCPEQKSLLNAQAHRK